MYLGRVGSGYCRTSRLWPWEKYVVSSKCADGLGHLDRAPVCAVRAFPTSLHFAMSCWHVKVGPMDLFCWWQILTLPLVCQINPTRHHFFSSLGLSAFSATPDGALESCARLMGVVSTVVLCASGLPITSSILDMNIKLSSWAIFACLYALARANWITACKSRCTSVLWEVGDIYAFWMFRNCIHAVYCMSIPCVCVFFPQVFVFILLQNDVFLWMSTWTCAEYLFTTIPSFFSPKINFSSFYIYFSLIICCHYSFSPFMILIKIKRTLRHVRGYGGFFFATTDCVHWAQRHSLSFFIFFFTIVHYSASATWRKPDLAVTQGFCNKEVVGRTPGWIHWQLIKWTKSKFQN